MIARPLNDVACLTKISQRAMDAMDSNDVRNMAARFETTRELAMWLRSLPQRNDSGDPEDGPRIACDVSQRVRIPNTEPNCVERSATYLAVAELIDPRPVRQLATIDTPRGRHTFPVEDGLPVRLDPAVPRNALDAGLFRMGAFDAERMGPVETLSWIGRIAFEPAARYRNGQARVRNARRGLRELADGRPLQRNAINDVGFVLAVAEQAARAFGVQGMELVKLGSMALQHAVRNAARPRARNLSIKLGGVRLGLPTPDLGGTLTGLARVGERLGGTLGAAAVRVALNQVGVTPQMIGEIERELRKDGLTLGKVAAKPARDSLAALMFGGLA